MIINPSLAMTSLLRRCTSGVPPLALHMKWVGGRSVSPPWSAETRGQSLWVTLYARRAASYIKAKKGFWNLDRKVVEEEKHPLALVTLKNIYNFFYLIFTKNRPKTLKHVYITIYQLQCRVSKALLRSNLGNSSCSCFCKPRAQNLLGGRQQQGW